MTTSTLSTGVTSTGKTVSSGVIWDIYGTAASFTVDGSGTETVFAGGIARVTTISGGTENVSSGGKTISTTVDDDGTLNVAFGGTATSTTLNIGSAVVDTGGAASFTTMNGNESVLFVDGGTVTSTTVTAGTVYVSGGGAGLDTVVNDSGDEFVYAGGSAVSTTIHSESLEAVGLAGEANGGVTTSTTVDGAATQYVYSGSIASFTAVGSGGYQYVSAAGTALSATVDSSGTETVFAGGIASATSVSRGTENVSSGGKTISTTVDDDGTLNVAFGGTATSTTLNIGSAVVDAGGAASFTTMNGNESVLFVDGGTVTSTTVTAGTVYVSGGGAGLDTVVNDSGDEFVYAGGSAVSTTIHSESLEAVGLAGEANGGVTTSTTVDGAATQYVYSGSIASFTTVGSGGYQYVSAAGTALSATVDSNATQTVFSGGIASFTKVGGGGYEYLSLGGAASFTTISSGGTETLSSGGSATSTTVSRGGMIDVTYLAFVSSGTVTPDPATDVLSFTEGAASYTQQLAGSYAREYFHLSPDSGSGTLITVNDAPCYCEGTRILTVTGEVPVEALRIGDHVVTASGATRPIRWIGRRHLDLRRHAAPELVQPIRLRADAIAAGVPRRDLLVSPDHGVLLDGGLIPARLLVNGASIAREVHWPAVAYYHVELATHDILLAEAMPAESFVDTGNRGMFENADGPLTLHADFSGGQQLRMAGSCRPLVDAPARVEPIWRRLAARAGMLGLRLPAAVATTDDPGLHVVVGGQAIRPVGGGAGRHAFVLPRRGGPVQLVSRAVRPCDLRPWVEDRRRLGVMVARLTLRVDPDVVPIPLDHPRLAHGWWDVERDRASLWRWTDGNAVIELSADGPAVLEVTLAGGPQYPIGPVAEPTPVRTSARTGTGLPGTSARRWRRRG